MKQILIILSFAILSFAVASCKKDNDVDPRDQYVGTYAMVASATTTAIGSTAGVLNTAEGNVDVVVQKGSDATQLKFSMPNNINLVATLDGGTFYMPPQSTSEKTASGYSYFKNYEGDGAFSDNKLTFNFSLSAKTDQVTAKQVTTLRGKKK